MLVVQPVSASQARLAAAERTSSGVSRAQTGYSALSQPNSPSSVAQPRVSHWYRWVCVLTSPGVTSSPDPSIRVAPAASSGGTGPGPTATIRSPSAAR